MKRLLYILLWISVGTANATNVVVTVGDGGNYFIPAYFTINPGDTVTWVWVSGHHNTSATSFPVGATTWYSNIDVSTTTYLYVASVSGLHKYTCTHHSGMDGQFFVTGCSYPSKPVVVSANGNKTCNGDTIRLSVTAQTGVSYQWINGVSTVTGANLNTLNVTTAGAYKVLVNRCGMDSVSTAFIVMFDSLPKPSFTYSNTGASYNFINTTNALTSHTYEWEFSDGSPNQLTTDALHTFVASGIYTITLKATNTITGCSDTFSQQVLIDLGIKNTGGIVYRISPNPACSIIEIQTNENVSIQVKDFYGRMVATPVQAYGKEYSVDVSSLPAGLYALSITTHTSTVTEQIAILR